MSSGSAQTDVERNSLLTQAGVWDAQSSAMGQMAQEISSSEITGVDSGMFASGVATYNTVCAEIGTWCSQGQQQMLAIVGALCTAARQYGATEEQISQASNNAFH
jgi:ABC-type multidrug transport system fused ATPase/permease subunit